MDPLVGKRIDNYEIVSVLGKGGMGIVYKARHVTLDKLYALKMIDSTIAEESVLLKMFQNEGKALARLNNRNIVGVSDYRTFGDSDFIVMEFVEGVTLARKLRDQRRLPVKEAFPIMMQVASAIQHAHNAPFPVIHRDIKPENIMITPDGEVKVMDFGIAKLKDSTGLTRTGRALGTYGYMSPEQLLGKSAGRQSDIWSMGTVFYQMLTGHLPFPGPQEAIYYATLNLPPNPIPDDVYLPEGLADILLKCLEKDLSKRYQDASEILKDLKQVEQNMGGDQTITIDGTLPLSTPRPSSLRKSSWLVISSVVALTVIAYAAKVFVNRQPPVVPDPIAFMTITSDPESCDVLINNRPAGRTPITALEQKPGPVTLKVRHPDYFGRDSSFALEAGKAAYSFKLMKVPQPPAPSPRNHEKGEDDPFISTGGWVSNVVGKFVSADESSQEARAQSKLRALSRALSVEKINVRAQDFEAQLRANSSSDALYEANRAFQGVLKSASAGFVSELRNVRTRTIDSSFSGPKFVYRTSFDAKITRRSGAGDPTFNASLALNKTQFTPDEKLTMVVSCTKDAYFTVLDISADGVHVLFPNSYQKRNFFKAGTKLSLGSEGITFPVSIPNGWDRAEEMVMVIATAGEADFSSLNPVALAVGNPRADALLCLLRERVKVPKGSYCEALEKFEIHRN